MSPMPDNHELEAWGPRLGLLPVPLYGRPQEQQFALLNGGQGNFCLDVAGAAELDPRSLAWSSDVGHFVRLTRHEVEVFRWDRPATDLQRFSKQKVYADLGGFHRYLESDEPRRELSIINHAARVFSMLRRVLGPEVEGPDTLRAFLYLLACQASDTQRGHLRLDDWRLVPQAAEIAERIKAPDWDALVNTLAAPLPVAGLQPDVRLLLRHASGPLFQEAHYQAYLPPQFSLPGIVPAQRVTLDLSSSSTTGAYFTPPALARTLVEEALAEIEPHPSTLTLFDPACGSGEFLREALRLLQLRGYTGKVHLIGWDISPVAVEMTRFILSWESRDWKANTVTFDVACRDSLQDDRWPSAVQATLMNPPFASWQSMTVEQQDRVVDVLGCLSSRKPNLASAFAYRAAGTLAPSGVLGAILPASVFDADSSAPLRGYLASKLQPRILGKLGSQTVFQSAMVDAVVYVGKHQGAPRPATVLWADHRPKSIAHALRHLRILTRASQLLEVVEGDGYSIYPSERLGRSSATWAPKAYQATALLERYSRCKKVGELFDVKQGVRLGNDVFVIPRRDWSALPKPERQFFRPAIMNESVQDGRLQTDAFIFYPYFSDAVGLGTEAELAQAVPTYYREYLLPQQEKLLKRARIKPDRWWRLMEHRAWLVKSAPKIVSTYFGGAGSFAFDTQGNHVVVVGYGWLPRAPIKKKMHERVWRAYVALLSSPLVDDLLGAVSVHIGGGQWNLSKKYIELMPLPDLTSRGIPADVFNALADAGERMSRGVADGDGDELAGFVEAAYISASK